MSEVPLSNSPSAANLQVMMGVDDSNCDSLSAQKTEEPDLPVTTENTESNMVEVKPSISQNNGSHSEPGSNRAAPGTEISEFTQDETTVQQRSNEGDQEKLPQDEKTSSEVKFESETIASRPKRRSAKSIDYKEKSETDIPSSVTKSEKRGPKARRGKSSSNSSSPPPSSSSISSSKNVAFFDVDDVIPINYQPPIAPGTDFNEAVDLRGARVDSAEITLTLKNGHTIKKGDCIYMICEPPTEPFYVAQVLGFTKKDKTSTNKKASNYMFSVCWFYRPRDLNRRLTDTRLVYASLHRDNCPLTSFRGFATVKHKSEIDNLEAYRQQPDCFYFDKLYDRYMIKMYDMIPTVQLVHLPPNYYKALNKRFAYIFVEVGKADELLSSPKNCEKCLQWCSSSDSIACSGCEKSYHLLCLDPPILTKPKRGFAWYCAACNKRLEDKLAENRGKMLESAQPSMIIKNEERASSQEKLSDQEADSQTLLSDDIQEADSSSLRYEQLAKKFLEDDSRISLKKRREIEEWPYRYLGVHAKFEDALDLQDRPYARAASRLGSKYQCTSITDWYDHQVQYYDTDASSSNLNNRRFKKNNNRNKKSNTPVHAEKNELENKKFPIPEQYQNLKPKQFPGWLQPKPKGYIERGVDETSTLLWKMPTNLGLPEKEVGDMIEKYIKDCAPVAKKLKLASVTTPNFVDAILLILMRHDYRPVECFDDVQKLTRDSLKEPTFTDEEIKKFEDSVRLHGSELYPVFKDVGTQTSAMVVRFYYLWKKTKSGHEIWDNFSGRAKNRLKSTKNVGVDLDNPEDDGAYASSKINRSQVKFKCIYCEANHSPEWFRAPGAMIDDENHVCEGLCYRCAKLWRKYAVKWENPIELVKNQEKKSSYATKRKTEYALIQEAELVVNARENYKLHPRKVSSGLKEYKTIDADFDYSLSNNDKFKKKPGRKPTVKAALNTPSQSSISATGAITSSIEAKVKVKKEKKDSAADKKSSKRSIKEVEPSSSSSLKENESANEETEKVVRKKRAYKKRQPTDKSLKFVYGKVVNDTSNGSMKFTTKKKEMLSDGNVPRSVKLTAQLEAARAQFEDNARSSLFNAFLDMKLRERIESLEKELALLTAKDTEKSYSLESISQSNYPSENEAFDPLSSPHANLSTSSRPSTRDSESYGFHTGKKYIRRRLFLSKTSVPGSGVFETPPIQLPMDAVTPLSTTTNVQNNLRNKFVFQLYDQRVRPVPDVDYNMSNSGAQFQSQPNLLPPNGTPPASTSSMAPSSSASNSAMASSSPGPGSVVTTAGSLAPSSASGSKKRSTSAGFMTGAIKNKEFVNLSPSFKVKMLTPLIDFNDRITKKMLSRYTTKFDVYNPLLSDDFYISPIYQMRPSSKELHVLWKQYQTSRKSKGRSNRQFQPLYPPDKRVCCVCREYGDTTKMLICSNCGLNVHASCYGVRLNSRMEKEAGAYNWHCDPCSNDLHPLVSTQYVCLLCNSRESNMDNAIKGDPISIPDALKRTLEGRWCHVSCSLLCENVKYGSKSLQPIYGAQVTGIKNIFKSCNICLSNGGSVVKCEFCSAKSHVTCGLDFGWRAGFMLLKVFDIVEGDVIEISGSNAVGKLKPIIYCDKHIIPGVSDIPSIYSLCDMGRRFNEKSDELSLLELYTADDRKRVPQMSSGLLRRKAYEEMNHEFAELVIKANLQNEYETREPEPAENHCMKCSRKSSLAWYPNPGGEAEGEICHVCYKSDKQQKLAPEIPSLDSVNTKQYDYSIYGC
ncbi:hypothetical protein PMKS-004133 [Pichia membranifaciens]|uniref:Uncharacterized protein n=1 Tax=Pichia membranifaciens TaxID=4926 RepID=A0A1Q2YM62_9ASCO|nr:hypothetical protein PMKS-004133 [Pichia membranifaciens]